MHNITLPSSRFTQHDLCILNNSVIFASLWPLSFLLKTKERTEKFAPGWAWTTDLSVNRRLRHRSLCIKPAWITSYPLRWYVQKGIPSANQMFPKQNKKVYFYTITTRARSCSQLFAKTDSGSKKDSVSKKIKPVLDLNVLNTTLSWVH